MFVPTMPLPFGFLPSFGASPAFYLSGYCTGVLAFAWLAKRRGLSTAGVWSVALVGLFGGLIGANLSQLIASGGKEPGKSVLGGIIGGYLCVHLYKRRIGLTRPLGDLFAFALSAGEAVGRWGCFFGECCYGRETDHAAWWSVYQHGAERYPTQVYMSVVSAAIFATLVVLEKRRSLPENGLFYVQGLLACTARFAIEYYRTAAPVSLGLTAAQWACLAGVAFFGGMLARMMQTSRQTLEAAS
ncbi:MAG: prolipoprotein diacylglyceryl transferase [Akkermansiaceae bacterium]|nr:prolipoprotein diacylglyceryl transferase [Armatimonadota bacterium]